ncbi:MAG: phage integrase SAM-like domain-containing protein, partial [Lachnospiraceae bacterium]|nr:phage integrase SAM-like domain-containing protein [Lachnospiraceae bacterium]
MCLTISEGIERYLDIHRASSSARTVQYYEENLRKFESFLDCYFITLGFAGYVYDIDEQLFLDYVMYLRKRGIKNVSINTYTRAVRSWCSWLLDNNYIEKSFVKGVRKLRDDSAIVYPLTFADVRYIDQYLIHRTYGQRDQIIFLLMLGCGLRRQEVINLNKEEIKEHCLVVRNSKYNKSRLVPL